MNIHYAHSEEAWRSSFVYLERLIINKGVRRALEVGGGCNPTFPLDFVGRHGLEYTVLDISLDELVKAPPGLFEDSS